MNFFYIDSSALVKRYHREKGTDPIDALFDSLLAKKANSPDYLRLVYTRDNCNHE